MPRNMFGSNYPPGAEFDPNAPWNQIDEDICEFCELSVDDCECYKCPICGLASILCTHNQEDEDAK